MGENTSQAEAVAPGLTLPRLPIAALAILVVVGSAVYGYAAWHGAEISRGTEYIWGLSYSYAVASWVEMDRRAKHIHTPLSLSAWMLFFWPILAPCYFFQALRWRGLLLAAALIVLCFVPFLVAFLLWPE
jgi:hypothetical protein